MNVLREKNDTYTNRVIVEELLNTSEHLQFIHAKQVYIQLSAIAGSDNGLQQKIYQYQQKQKLDHYWNRYRIATAILAAILFCFLIYKLST
jgi:hypothetical protein